MVKDDELSSRGDALRRGERFGDGHCERRTASAHLGRVHSVDFFFQAEDGIRDVAVTGVQTCALPISGGVLDGTSGSLLGTFPAAGPVASDSTVGRAFILNSSGSFGMYDQITAFNESTFVPIGSFSVAGVGQPGGTNPSSLVRWGADGLAFRTPSQIYIVRNALVRDLSGTTTDLSVSMSAPASGTSGTNATVTMTVKNNGPNQVSGATLRDMYTAGATFVSVTSSTGTCGSIPVVQCDLGDLANGATAAVTLVLQLTTPGSVTNTATISGNLPDSNLGDNTATATTNVTGAIYSLLQ